MPEVMSFRPAEPTLYRSGFKKPRDGFPAAIRASFRRVMILANTYNDSLVELCDVANCSNNRRSTPEHSRLFRQ